MGLVRKTGLSILTLALVGSANIAKADPISDITDAISNGDVIIDAITNLGAKLWQIVAKGSVVVTEKPMVATALPKGVTDWNQLQGWKMAYLQDGIQIHQPIGGTVVNYDYRLVFTYNGSAAGVGKYIGYATIEKVDLNSKWLAPELNVWVDVPTVFNMGTAENPLAAMKLDIHVETQRVISGVKLQKTDIITSYVITGTGQVRRL